jgi:peptidoglycan/LPS O-acetylase OafA/YrhL
VISYGLYLWQGPVLERVFGVTLERSGLIAVPAIGAAVACAILSYYLVERPFLRRKRRPLRVENERPQLAETRVAEAPA